MLPFLRSGLTQLTAYTAHTETLDQQALVLDHLDTNESPWDLPTTVKQTLAQVYQTEVAANRYPDGSHTALKREIAEYVNESALLPDGTVTDHHLSVGNGSDELIRSLLIATCLGHEGSILVADPTFSMYGILARTLGISVTTVGRSPQTFEIDLSAAQTALDQTTAPPIRLVFVVHPNSPTGNALTDAELKWLRSLPQNILIVIDEAYFEFSQTSVVKELLGHSNWVILRTFSKAFRLAAHRVGYAIAHPEVIAVLEKVRLPYNLPTFSQLAAHTALRHRQDLLASLSDLLQQRRQVIETLSQYPCLQVFPSDANFVFVQFDPMENISNEVMLQKIGTDLKQQGTLIRLISGGLRITIGSPAENERMLGRLYDSLLRSGLIS